MVKIPGSTTAGRLGRHKDDTVTKYGVLGEAHVLNLDGTTRCRERSQFRSARCVQSLPAKPLRVAMRIAIASRWSKFPFQWGSPKMGQQNNAARNTVLARVIAPALAVTAPVLAQVGAAPNTMADSAHLKTEVEVKQEQERKAVTNPASARFLTPRTRRTRGAPCAAVRPRRRINPSRTRDNLAPTRHLIFSVVSSNSSSTSNRRGISRCCMA
jgi:hypothetical protein